MVTTNFETIFSFILQSSAQYNEGLTWFFYFLIFDFFWMTENTKYFLKLVTNLIRFWLNWLYKRIRISFDVWILIMPHNTMLIRKSERKVKSNVNKISKTVSPCSDSKMTNKEWMQAHWFHHSRRSQLILPFDGKYIGTGRDILKREHGISYYISKYNTLCNIFISLKQFTSSLKPL